MKVVKLEDVEKIREYAQRLRQEGDAHVLGMQYFRFVDWPDIFDYLADRLEERAFEVDNIEKE
jgi:hypothetical protein